jgi:hypothetical protein
MLASQSASVPPADNVRCRSYGSPCARYYQFVRRLKYARDDALKIKEFLETDGEVESILLFTDDSPEVDSKSTIASRSNLLNFFHSRFVDPFLKPEDNLWFFFSGHGARTAGQDYLLPIDGLAESVADTGISVRFITERLSRSGAGNILLILDGCRDVGDGGIARPKLRDCPTDRQLLKTPRSRAKRPL